MSVFVGERAARVLLDAMLFGDRLAAEKWQVSERTVRNHRGRLDTDKEFAALFLRLKSAAERDWRVVRLRFLRNSIAKLEALVESAEKPESIRDVADAIRIIGELQLASEALSGDLEGDRAGEAVETAPRDAADDAEGAIH